MQTITATRLVAADSSLLRLVSEAWITLLAAAEKPLWSIGFSGGKDSSVLLDLVLRFLSAQCSQGEACPKMVAVVYADTLLEPPPLRNYARQVIAAVNEVAAAEGLPVVAEVAEPAPGEDIVAMVIVKGYPAPSARFRWCSDRWKIRPSRLVINKLLGAASRESLAVITGVRAEEAAHRASRNPAPGAGWTIIERDDLGGSAYAPLHSWRTSDIWLYMQHNPSPYWRHPGWDTLRKAYLGLPSLRMGCWACTLVTQDKGWETLSKYSAIAPNAYLALNQWRKLWLHMSRKRPDLWRLPKTATRTKKGRVWRHHYSKLKLEARLLLLDCLRRLLERPELQEILQPLRSRLALYRQELDRLEQYRNNAVKMLALDPEAEKIVSKC